MKCLYSLLFILLLICSPIKAQNALSNEEMMAKRYLAQIEILRKSINYKRSLKNSLDSEQYKKACILLDSDLPSWFIGVTQPLEQIVVGATGTLPKNFKVIRVLNDSRLIGSIGKQYVFVASHKINTGNELQHRVLMVSTSVQRFTIGGATVSMPLLHACNGYIRFDSTMPPLVNRKWIVNNKEIEGAFLAASNTHIVISVSTGWMTDFLTNPAQTRLIAIQDLSLSDNQWLIENNTKSAEWGRIWISVDGKYKIRAKMTKLTKNYVYLTKKDGTTFKVERKQLHQDDQDYIYVFGLEETDE